MLGAGLVGAIVRARSLDRWFFRPDAGGGDMEAANRVSAFVLF